MDYNYGIVTVLILMLAFPFVTSIDVTDCNDVWEKTDLTTYSYKIDCSNLGFTKTPENIPKFTSRL